MNTEKLLTLAGTLPPATGYVVSSGAPDSMKEAAWIMKARHGDLAQICRGVDDYPEIQAALDAVSALGGGTVRLSHGQFALPTTPVAVPDYCNLKGMGWATTLIPGINNAALRFQGGQRYITLSEFRIGLQDTSGIDGNAMIFDNGSGLINIDHVEFFAWGAGTNRYAVKFQSTDGLTSGIDVSFKKCYFLSLNGVIATTTRAEGISFTDYNHFRCLVGGENIRMANNGSWIFTGNLFENGPVHLYGKRFIFNSNDVESVPSSHGLWVEGTNCPIVGNTFTNLNYLPANTGDAIIMHNCEAVSFVGNTYCTEGVGPPRYWIGQWNPALAGRDNVFIEAWNWPGGTAEVNFGNMTDYTYMNSKRGIYVLSNLPLIAGVPGQIWNNGGVANVS